MYSTAPADWTKFEFVLILMMIDRFTFEVSTLSVITRIVHSLFVVSVIYWPSTEPLIKRCNCVNKRKDSGSRWALENNITMCPGGSIQLETGCQSENQPQTEGFGPLMTHGWATQAKMRKKYVRSLLKSSLSVDYVPVYICIRVVYNTTFLCLMVNQRPTIIKCPCWKIGVVLFNP